jgi:hypothetical protein
VFVAINFLITFYLHYNAMRSSTQLILTGTVLHWKGKHEEARKEWESKKEAAKKEKDQKRAEEITSNNKHRVGKRTVKPSTFFTVEDNRLEKFNKRKV